MLVLEIDIPFFKPNSLLKLFFNTTSHFIKYQNKVDNNNSNLNFDILKPKGVSDEWITNPLGEK